MRSFLRERQVVLFSIAVPVVLYPLLLWGMFTMMSLAQERGADLRPRVGLVGPSSPRDLPGSLADLESVEWLAVPADSQRAAEAVGTDSLDAVLIVRPGPSFEMLYDGSGEAGPLARRRIGNALEDAREHELRRRAMLHGVSPTSW